MEICKHVIATHGRVENITLYNKDPYPSRKAPPNDKKELKPRVPPYRHLDKLLELAVEKEAVDKKREAHEKKLAEMKANNEYIDEKKYNELEMFGDPKRFEILTHFDFPTFEPGQGRDTEHIIQYDEADISLEEITKTYGTIYRPNIDPKKDPLPPEPKEILSPSKVKEDTKDEEEKEGEGDEEGEADDVPIGEDGEPQLIQEEEEEEFVPPVHVVIYYDFDAYNGRDPILLA